MHNWALPIFQAKRAQNGFRRLGPLTFKRMTTALSMCISKWGLQGVQVQSGPFISSIVFIPLVVRGCNIHFIIQKGGENDAQLLKL